MTTRRATHNCRRAIAGAALLICGLGIAIAEDKAESTPRALTIEAQPPTAKGASEEATPPAATPPTGSASGPQGAPPPKDVAQPSVPPSSDGVAPPAVPPIAKACTDAQAALDTARAARKLADGVAALEKMKAPDAGCQPDVLFCAGRKLALTHVEAAYAAVEKGNLASAEQLLVQGRRFGDPWQLLIGLGDAAITRAHAKHERKDWAEASKAYQHALLSFGTPSLCAGEAPPPEPAALQPLFERLGTAMLLADTPDFARMKCGGVCELPFLSPVAGFRPPSQVLPITFEAKTATLTQNGTRVVKAFAVCMEARRATQVTLAARTSATPNAKALAAARLEAIRRVFTEGGAKAELTTTAEEDAQSAPADRGQTLSRAEQNALSERIELRDVTAAGTPDC